MSYLSYILRGAGGSVIVTGDRNVVQRGKYNIQIGRASGLTIGGEK